MRALSAAVLGLAALCVSPANANSITILASSVTAGATTFTTTGPAGVPVTFTGSGPFEKKERNGFTGLGIAGGIDAEIDGIENLRITFGGAGVNITEFVLAFLFDGPEFGDVNEVARLTLGNGQTATLTARYVDALGLVAIWSTSPGVVTNLSPATDNGAGVWRVANPFGGTRVTSITFDAQPGQCGIPPCTSQTDYALVSLTLAVPEPSTYALLAAGLAMVGFTGMRRARR